MKRLLKENGFISHRKGIYMLGAVVVVLGGMTGIVAGGMLKSEQELAAKENCVNSEKYCYQVTNQLDGIYAGYLQKENDELIWDWNAEMHAMDELTFVECYKRNDVILQAGTEEGHYDALFVGRNYFEEFPVKLSEGEIFSEEAYVYEQGKAVPILLGASYADEYEIGDTFWEGTYSMYSQVYVAGFLAEDEEWIQANDVVESLDLFVIFPMFEFSEELAQLENGDIYMRNHGFVKTDLEYCETQDKLDEVSKKVGIPAIYRLIMEERW